MHIGELAKRFGVTVESIRYYEREGLLPGSRRTAGNYRVYDEQHAGQLSFVLNCRSLDMSHEEIRRLLVAQRTPGRDCADVNKLVDGHIEKVGQRISELKQLLNDLKMLRRSCAESRAVQHCEILSALSRPSHSANHRRAAGRG